MALQTKIDLISHTLSGAAGNSDSFLRATSNGRFVIFFSYASDLTGASDTNGAIDAFLYDTADGSVGLISHTLSGAAGNGYSIPGAISGDGRYVTFSSSSSDLTGASDLNGASDAFLYDTADGSVDLISHTLSGAAGNRDTLADCNDGREARCRSRNGRPSDRGDARND